MGDVKPLGQDPATQKQHELVSAIAKVGTFGNPVQQEGSNGQEFLFHCPICIEDDGKGEGHRPHLFVAKATTSGRDNPYYGCRIHDSPADYKRIQKAFVSAGVASNLLGGKSKRGMGGTSLDPSGTDKSAYAEFKSRPMGLGETHPIPEGRIQRWQASLFEDSATAKRIMAYLQADRGLTSATIQAAEFGLAGNKLVLPIRGANGDVVSARYRIIRTEGKPSPWKPYPHPKLKKEDGTTPETYGAPSRLYGVREIALDTAPADDGRLRPVWVCAGEFDRLTLLECGALSVCSTNGEGSLPRLEDAEYLRGRDVYLVFDCDTAGRKGARKFAAAATKVGANTVYVLDLDPERDDGYDISDYFRDNDTPEFDAFENLCNRISVLEPYELPVGTDLRLDELSDRRMAEIVAERYVDELKFVTPSQTWIQWDGQCWRNMAYRDNAPATNAIVATARDVKEIAKSFEDPEFSDMVRGWAHNYINRMHSSAREHITTMAHMRVQLDALDRLPVLNTPNGILHLDTGRVEKHNPASLLRWMTNGSYLAGDPKELPPDDRKRFSNWNSFLKRVLPSAEMRRYVQKLLGYSLLDGNPQRLLIFVKGGTSTGKSVFAETVMAALGSYAGPFNMSLLRDNQDEKPRADIVESLTQRIIFASETSSAWHLHADAIKRMTGGDTIKARLPHRGEYFERIPAFTPWVRTNEVPQVTAADMALDRRLVVIPFDVMIAQDEEDHEAMEALRRNSGDAVITWAMNGLRRYHREGLGDLPVASIEAKFEFSSQLSPMHVFIEDLCERGTDTDPEYRIEVAELYGAYENWCFINGVKDALNKIEFGRRLSQIGVGVWIDKSTRYRTGIRLKSEMVMK